MKDLIRNSSFRTISLFYVALILFFGTLFFVLTSVPGQGLVSNQQPISSDIGGYSESIYFSFVTSTSLGYGDIRPLGVSRALSVIEVMVSLVIFGILISKLLYANQDKILEELYKVSFEERFTRIISGLYGFRAELDGLIAGSRRLRKNDADEFIQNIESNLHFLSTYVSDSEKILIEFRKNKEKYSDFKEDLLLDNIHDSIAKLEQLFSGLKARGIKFTRPKTAGNLKMILKSSEKICKNCIKHEHQKIKDVIEEITKHSNRIREQVKVGL